MCGHIRREKIKNEVIQNKGEWPSWLKMMEARLRWFGHIREDARMHH